VSERFLPGDEAGAKALKALRRHVASEIEDAGWLDPLEAGAVGIGGTIRNLATAAERRAGLPYTDAQGFAIGRDELGELIDELASLPVSKRGNVPGIKPDRGDVILGGAVVLGALMDAIGADEIEATDAGLREGIFFEHFLSDRDPPIFEDVRRASVENLAHRYEQDMEHAGHVAHLSLQLYDQLERAGVVEAADEDRELLWAACMLHDIGTTVDYDDHHKHSRYLILNAGLPGFTPRELNLVAAIARYHRKGEPDVSEFGDLAREGDDDLLALLSGIIRLAEQLERSRDRSIGGVQLAKSDGKLMLDAKARGGDPFVAIWSARRSADLLERALDREIEIETTSQ